MYDVLTHTTRFNRPSNSARAFNISAHTVQVSQSATMRNSHHTSAQNPLWSLVNVKTNEVYSNKMAAKRKSALLKWVLAEQWGIRLWKCSHYKTANQNLWCTGNPTDHPGAGSLVIQAPGTQDLKSGQNPYSVCSALLNLQPVAKFNKH